ncbi:Fic family protein [Helicobacter sp. NHP21005]|uniref:Fic family protein n=1 Tax=Helicobacter felistomachi TaxID=3040201 RepID=UPI0025742D3D|nr:Fic family protein [Helicobacter sp. NHP21005]BEG57330.1 Fic family protein [Helicobacter sp. NHP21005]
MPKWIWEHTFFKNMDFVYESIDMSNLFVKIHKLNQVAHNVEILAEVLSDELIYSFLIEAEKLNRASLYASFEHILNNPTATSSKQIKPTDSLAMLLHNTREDTTQWDKERLLACHRGLLISPKYGLWPIDIGAYRKDLYGRMQVVSVRGNKESIHYIAPPAKDLEGLMQAFLHFANHKEGTPEKQIAHAFLTHLIFVLIHPFDDGNGRMARLIHYNLLAHSKVFSTGYYGLSLGIYKTRKDYYDTLDILNKQQHNNLTEWVKYGVKSLEVGIDLIYQQAGLIMFKECILKRFSQELNANQVQILNSLFARHLKSLRGDCVGTALKAITNEIGPDILRLRDLGILKEVAEKRFELDFSMAKRVNAC